MDAYVAKPVQVAELLEAIQRLAAPIVETTPAAASLPIPPVEDLDMKEALAAVGSDLNLLRELAHMFLAFYPGQMDALREAVARGDRAAVRLVAHTLKGAVSMFGARAPFEAARRLEGMARAGNLDGAEEVLATLVEALVQVRPALVALADQRGGAG
jgi:HPt (histidine-containing phosphotransfer) domain-containing protein